MNAQQVTTMRQLWSSRSSVKEIAFHLGVKLRRVQRYMEHHRHLFPERRGTKPRTAFQKPPANVARLLAANQMRWITEQGATVTLPRISFINCPRQENGAHDQG